MKVPSLLIVICILMGACARTPRTVPEITPQLEERPLKHTEADSEPAGITVYKNHLVVIRKSGTILKLDPLNLEKVMTAQLTDKIRPGIISGGGKLLLRTEESPLRWIILDLETFREINRITPASESEQVAAIGHNILVTQKQNKLVATTFDSDPKSREIEIPVADFRACRIHGDRVLILSRTELIQLQPPVFVAQRSKLPHPAAGDFLLRDEYLYYGGENRLLIKWAPRSRKPEWTAPLPRILKLAPINAGKLVAVLPQDQHIHFFTPGGGHTWWSSLNGTRLYPPLRLDENIAVFLYPHHAPEIRFFNWKKHTTASHKGANPLRDPPLAVGGRLFFLVESEGEVRLHTLTNRRGVEIEIKPEFPRVSGRSLEFRISPINLIRPEFNLSVRRRKSKTPVLNTKLLRTDPTITAWLPRDSGEYVLEVEAISKDGFKAKARKQFSVHDLAEFTRVHVSAIQAACHGDYVAGGDAKP
ncbi:MAG TPA: hypothetical protein ENN40_03120 [Candidatus Aminicenantes bacterium]|nr:hypothetical protein [Candidatus Aminicenantes bacterium]